MSTTIDYWQAMRTAAQAALPNAHAPYSRFRVAAALLTADGGIVTGVNVENASYGLTLCAERNAVAAAVVQSGSRLRILGLVVVSSGTKPTPPCGACRQVLSEFPPSFEVRCYGADSSELCTTSEALLPYAFGTEHLDK